MSVPIPDDVRRFLLTHIPSVPHLETLLLLWREPGRAWSVEAIAARLYVSHDRAARMVDDLCRADFLDAHVQDEQPGAPRYRFHSEPALAQVLPRLDLAHARRLCEVTALIHSNAKARRAPFMPATDDESG